jgi:hypothetical protein
MEIERPPDGFGERRQGIQASIEIHGSQSNNSLRWRNIDRFGCRSL